MNTRAEKKNYLTLKIDKLSKSDHIISINGHSFYQLFRNKRIFLNWSFKTGRSFMNGQFCLWSFLPSVVCDICNRKRLYWIQPHRPTISGDYFHRGLLAGLPLAGLKLRYRGINWKGLSFEKIKWKWAVCSPCKISFEFECYEIWQKEQLKIYLLLRNFSWK